MNSCSGSGSAAVVPNCYQSIFFLVVSPQRRRRRRSKPSPITVNCMNPHPTNFNCCDKILFSHTQRGYQFLFLDYFILFRFFFFCYSTFLLIFTKIMLLLLYIYIFFFFVKIIFTFSCSGMFRNVPECSGMFRVPGFIDGHQ